MEYGFYGWQSATCTACNDLYPNIDTPRKLYEVMQHVWCVETCAPRLRPLWSEANNTVGQCSITALLVQDIFGGEIYGIPLEDGAVHCYNVVGDCLFDLTSEQFGDVVLDYTKGILQSRAEQLKDQGKRERYLLLCQRLHRQSEM